MQQIFANGGRRTNSAAAAAVSTATGHADNDANRTNGTIFNSITTRPLDPHQTVIPVDATNDDLARPLLG